MIKYSHFVSEDAQGVTNILEECNIRPEQIISITSKANKADTYRYEYTRALNIYIDTYFVVFYWYEEED